ncbi:MAG: alanine dehydrogenase, partial [Anaerotignaceae bacterium]
MIFGLLKDIKNGEYRVVATPSEISTIVANGHTALIEKDAGLKAGFSNEEYEKAGGQIIETAKEVWEKSEFITKV